MSHIFQSTLPALRKPQFSYGGLGKLQVSGAIAGCHDRDSKAAVRGSCPGTGTNGATPDCNTCNPKSSDMTVPAALVSAKDNMSFPFAQLANCGVFEGAYVSGAVKIRLHHRGNMIVGSISDKRLIVARQDPRDQYRATGYMLAATSASDFGPGRALRCIELNMSPYYGQTEEVMTIAAARCYIQGKKDKDWHARQLAYCRVPACSYIAGPGGANAPYLSLRVDVNDPVSPIAQRIKLAQNPPAVPVADNAPPPAVVPPGAVPPPLFTPPTVPSPGDILPGETPPVEEAGFPWIWVGVGAGVLTLGTVAFFLLRRR